MLRVAFLDNGLTILVAAAKSPARVWLSPSTEDLMAPSHLLNPCIYSCMMHSLGGL